MIAGTPVDVIAEFYPALAGLDETGSLEALKAIPTLVLTGEDDRMIPEEHSELLIQRLPDADFVVVRDAGHMVLLERPEAVTRALTRLIRRVLASAEAGSARG
jgi:pimeloyl-ACP methyl ester carboxylesterase